MQRSIMKKALLIIAVVALMAGFGFGKALAETKVGIFLWSDEERYTDTRDGMLAALKKEGYAEPKVKFVQESAGGNKAKAAEISKKFNNNGYSLILVLGTSAAVALAQEVREVPIVFSMVSDAVDSKIAASWKSSGNNTTGTCTKQPMAKLLNGLKQIAPVKKLAVVYTQGEKNSEFLLRELQAEQSTSGIKIVPVPITSKDDAVRLLDDVVRSVDAVYLTGSTGVDKSLSLIVETTIKAKVITVSTLEDRVEKGALIGFYSDAKALGQLAGEKAAKVLKGAKPSSIPIETLKQPDIIVNMKTAKAAGVQIPPSLLKSATRLIE
jgi:putative ABC transport system substrate-binding protein